MLNAAPNQCSEAVRGRFTTTGVVSERTVARVFRVYPLKRWQPISNLVDGSRD